MKALLGLLSSVAAGLLLMPTELPTLDPLVGPAVQATAVTTFALRLVGTALLAYVALVLLAVLALQLRLLPRRLHATVDRWTAGGLAGNVRRLVGASALAVGLLTPTAAHAAEAPPPVMAPMDVPPTTTTAPPAPPSTPPTVAPVTTPPPRPEPPPVTPAHAPEPRVEPARTVTVHAGDSFWSITEALLTLRNHRPPTDPEVIGPWLDLIAANRDVLPDPGDPNLLLPGAVLTLP